jgi:hypothetical protein
MLALLIPNTKHQIKENVTNHADGAGTGSNR